MQPWKWVSLEVITWCSHRFVRVYGSKLVIDIECLLIQGNLCIKSELLQTEMTHSAHINDAAGMPEKDVMIWQIVTPVNMAVSLLWAKSTN